MSVIDNSSIVVVLLEIIKKKKKKFFFLIFFFFKQKTAFEVVSRDWSSNGCSSDLGRVHIFARYNLYKTKVSHMAL